MRSCETGLNPQDRDLVHRSIALARRIKAATLAVSENRQLPQDVATSLEQERLGHAEALTVVTSKLIVGALYNATPQDEREALDAALGELGERYASNRYPEYTYSGVGVESSLIGLWHDAVMLNTNWRAGLTASYTTRNNIQLTPDELLSDVGIIAPLSTDHLRARMHREFVTQHVQPVCFGVKPAAVHVSSETTVLPLNQNNQPVFYDRQYVGVYVDVMVSGDTAKVVFNAVRGAYPGKTVYGAGAIEREDNW